MRKRSWLTIASLLSVLAVGALLFLPLDGAGAQGPEGSDPQDEIDLVDAGPPAYESLQIEAEAQPEPQDTIGAAAVGSGFTYQGRLFDSGSPANGTYDLQLVLYTAEVGGSQVGGTLLKENVSVQDGLFTVMLDFGSSAFTGDPRYMEIGVRPGDSTGAFSVLSPRRPITPTPYAVYAGNADRLDGYDSSYFSSIYHNHDSRYLRRRMGTQFSGTLNAGQTKSWFTFGWPADEIVYWSIHPTTDDGRVEWSVEIKRNTNNTFTYYLTVTNVGAATTTIDAKYVRFE
jgi:hypothetical protein